MIYYILIMHMHFVLANEKTEGVVLRFSKYCILCAYSSLVIIHCSICHYGNGNIATVFHGL